MLKKKVCRICRNDSYGPEALGSWNDICDGTWKAQRKVYCPPKGYTAYLDKLKAALKKGLTKDQLTCLDQWVVADATSWLADKVMGSPVSINHSPPVWCPYKSEHEQG